jgi:hypothetical protein
MTVDRVLGPARSVNLGQLTQEVRAVVGDDAITGLSADKEHIIAHFPTTPADALIQAAAGVLAAHVPVVDPEPQAVDVVALIENAASIADLKAALLAAFGKG